MNVYMDLDDTLIQTQQLFERYKRACASFILIEDKSDSLTIGEVMSVFNEREEHNIDRYGYQNKRFITSWKETYQHFYKTGKNSDVIGRLAERVFYDESPLMKEAQYVLDTLKKLGYPMTIITCGVEDVQNRRIDQAGIRGYFNAIHVVPYKDKVMLESIITDKEQSVMVGNSMRSDINPALEMGIPAIHVKAPSWFHDEAERSPGDDYYHVELLHVPIVINHLDDQFNLKRS